MDIKKTWEKLLVAYPNRQAFALPMYKDKQLSQPTPIAYYIIGMQQKCSPTLWDTPMAYGYNTPSMDASLRYLLVHYQSCEV